MNAIVGVIAFAIAVVIINPRSTNSGRFIDTAVVSTILIVDTVAVVDVYIVIIINRPNSSSSR